MAKTTNWFGFSADMMRLGFESQSVIGMRMMRLAGGGRRAETEATLMFAEKANALVVAQMEMARSVMTGAGHLGPERALRSYRRVVRANRRRLAAG